MDGLELNPLVPFEPISATTIPSGLNWIAQMKWDGVRMLFYYDGHSVRLINRKGNDRTMQYPEFADPSAYCTASTFILDGELIAFDASKPSFQEVMKRDSLRHEASIRRGVSETPVTYMVFDVLFANGSWVTDLPLRRRQQLLAELIKSQKQVQLVTNHEDAAALLEVMRTHDMEGVVCKQIESTYAINGKDGRWQKIKIFYDLYAVIAGVIIKDKIVRSVLLGLYDEEGSLIYIGHAGAGKLKDKERVELTSLALKTAVADMPFRNRPERSKEAQWMAPSLVVKVQFMEWTANNTMRHPTIQAIVTNVPVSDCTIKQT
ncbi:ATP-dependent DNA ligase [Cohnella mopanensis]|uniref:ATP-dependent DNA ligase n=1 Tax=Cohnella mopanensis TaxID=2911966 RepID=UPI001EF951CB|nr:RNA ligase family protein [Cohnella mopanensis]